LRTPGLGVFCLHSNKYCSCLLKLSVQIRYLYEVQVFFKLRIHVNLGFDSRSDHIEDLKNCTCGPFSLVLGFDGWFARKQFTDGDATDLPPAQHSLRKQPLFPGASGNGSRSRPALFKLFYVTALKYILNWLRHTYFMKSKTYFSQTLQRELLIKFCCF